MSRVIAVACQKGGVAKTTTTYNLGHALAANGNTVLLCDFDPQASLTLAAGLEIHRLSGTIYDLLVPGAEERSSWDLILPTATRGLSILPSSIDLSQAEIQLVNKMGRERTLRKVTDTLRRDFDFILLDCPPTLGLLLTNALTAADDVLVPIESDYLSLRALEHLLPTIDEVRRELNPELRLLGILITKHQQKTTHARDSVEELRKAFGEKVFQAVIPYRAKARDAVAAGQSIFDYDPHSPVADAYQQLAGEVLARVGRPQRAALAKEAASHG